MNRILLTRLRLINWHGFIDDTFTFGEIATYLGGPNGSGKSTLQDSMRYLLTTRRDFNRASNPKGKRTLQGYVHHLTHDGEYLRPEHTVSYIGMEFFDESLKRFFVIVARIECESPSDDTRTDWYITKPGYALEDLPFLVTTKEGRKRPASREEFKLDSRGMDHTNNSREARRRMFRQLGLGDENGVAAERFLTVFNIGSGVSEITDLRAFLRDYVLPAPATNMDEMLSDMRELNRWQETWEMAKQQADTLEEISAMIVEALALDRKVNSITLLNNYVRWQYALEKTTNNNKEQQKIKTKIASLESHVEELEKQVRFAMESLMEARDRQRNSDEYKSIELLQKELDEKNSSFDSLCRRAKSFAETSSEARGLFRQLENKKIVPEGTLVLPEPSPDFPERLGALKGLLESAVASFSSMLIDLKSRENLLSDEILSLDKEIKQLSSGRIPYPEDCQLVLNAINEQFLNDGVDAKAKPLCDLISVVKTEWQDAVESYLNTQRFYIVVPPEQYLRAKAVFVSMKKQIRQAGLLDTVSLSRINKAVRHNTSEDSPLTLAQTVETENLCVRAFLESVLGGVICCDSTDGMELHQRSVTKDLWIYQNHVLRRMQELPRCIGREAIQTRLQQAKDRLRQAQKEKTDVVAEYKEYDALHIRYQRFTAGPSFDVLGNDYRAKQEADVLSTERHLLQSQIEELQNNPILRGMIDLIKDRDEKYRACVNALTDEKGRLVSSQEELRKLAKAQEQYGRDADSFSSSYYNDEEKFPDAVADMREEYRSEMSRSDVPAGMSPHAFWIQNNDSQGFLARRRAARDNYIQQTLIPKQKEYNGKTQRGYALGLEDYASYQTDLSTLQNVDFEHIQSQLFTAKERCRERFRSDIVARLQDGIMQATRLFRELNRVLDSLPLFGRESYRFHLGRSSNKEFGMFYDIIMDKEKLDALNQLRAEDVPSMFVSNDELMVYENQLNEFMDRIMAIAGESARRAISGSGSDKKQSEEERLAFQYASYLTYIDYDVQVTIEGRGTGSLAAMIGSSSGGETEAPLDVIIVASLLQTYQLTGDSCHLSLCLMDEAFSRMDSNRAEVMAQMFRQVGMQFVIGGIIDRYGAIAKYIDVATSLKQVNASNGSLYVQKPIEELLAYQHEDFIREVSRDDESAEHSE